MLIPLTPVVANRISKNGTVLVECRGSDAAAYVGVSLEAVLGVLVPEVECPVRPGGAEGAMNWVEGDVVDGVDIGDAVDDRITVTFE